RTSTEGVAPTANAIDIVTRFPITPGKVDVAAQVAAQVEPEVWTAGESALDVGSCARASSATAVIRTLNASPWLRLGLCRTCSADPTTVGDGAHGLSSAYTTFPAASYL